MDFISDIDAVKRSLIESTELIKSFEDGKWTVFCMIIIKGLLFFCRIW